VEPRLRIEFVSGEPARLINASDLLGYHTPGMGSAVVQLGGI
jgi:hypothetical protein